MSENQTPETPEAPQPAAADEQARPNEDAPPQPQREIGPGELKRLLNIEIPIIAVMAEKTMTLKEILNLTIGSIIQLDKPAEEHLDLLVNNQRIGQGQTVRVGDNFGLKITALGSLRETIRKLGRTPDETDEPQPDTDTDDAEDAAENAPEDNPDTDTANDA